MSPRLAPERRTGARAEAARALKKTLCCAADAVALVVLARSHVALAVIPPWNVPLAFLYGVEIEKGELEESFASGAFYDEAKASRASYKETHASTAEATLVSNCLEAAAKSGRTCLNAIEKSMQAGFVTNSLLSACRVGKGARSLCVL